MTAAERVVRFFHDVDRQDWAGVRAGLADEVRTDYTSLFGGEPERIAADDLVARWRGLLPGFDATQHLLGPVVPDAAGTGLECNVHATHRLAGAEGRAGAWVVAGRYALEVDEAGRLTSIVLHTAWEEGDRALTEMAAERAAG